MNAIEGQHSWFLKSTVLSPNPRLYRLPLSKFLVPFTIKVVNGES
jgi:hypothetical protein